MSKKEKIFYFLLAFAVGALVGYLFYGGLAKDEFSQPTRLTYILNCTIMLIVGIVAGKVFLPIRTEQILKKRKNMLTRQFRDMLDGLTTSLGAGNNIMDSLYAVREDFGIRSNIDDIKSFAEVFKVSYRKGGNIKDVIQNTYTILNDKMEIREEIETVVTSSKTEQNLMLVMPVALIGVIKSMSPDFAADFATASGVLATTIAIIIFAVAYYVGKKILDIKI